MRIPVGLVLLADPFHVERHAGIPVGGIFGIRHAGKIRHPHPVRGQPAERHDAHHGKRRAPFHQPIGGIQRVVIDPHLVADPGPQVVGFPRVEHRPFGHVRQEWRGGGIHRRDH